MTALSMLYAVTLGPIAWVVTLPYTYPTLALPLYLAGALSIIAYLVIVVLQNILDRLPVDLKKKYNAEWAVVTGASSGIGLAMANKLCTQGVNVVMVALDDAMLQKSYDDLTKRFKNLQIRKVGVNLGKEGAYMDIIKQKTQDISVQLVFNNAGFITTGFFTQADVGRLEANMHCNASCIVPITHHFAKRMEDEQKPGLIAFTSSSAGFVPNPLSVMYPSTKSFMTFFATSLAPELKRNGIDVVVVHPSPMATNFFSNSGGLQALEYFKQFAVGPEVIADVVFNSAGRFVVRDQGLITIAMRIVTKCLDFVFFAEIVNRLGHLSGDFSAMDKTKKR